MIKKPTFALLLVLAALVGGLILVQIRKADVPRQQEPGGPPAALLPAVPAPPTVAQAPTIKFPVQQSKEAASEASPLPSLQESDAYIGKALSAILGGKIVQEQLQLQDIVHRCVATVDNLGRAHAPSALWPVNPAQGRFASMIAEGAGGTSKEVILDGNDARYAPFVNMLDAIDMSALATLYFHLYPLFQKEYEELGYPQAYFNDRLVEVLDLLIATPQPPRPLEVTLVQVEGNVKPLRPWVRYEFKDPALQNLASGQKILLRIGKENGAIVRRKLIEFRKLVAGNAASNGIH